MHGPAWCAKPVEPASPGAYEALRGLGVPRAETAAGAPGACAFETTAGAVIGTPAFMAPEALRGEHVDERADQFSFSVALFHGLYGALPYPGGPLAERTEQIARGIIARPAGAAVTEPVFRVIARGLAAHPDDRHPSMAALVSALEAAVELALAPRPPPRPPVAAIDYGIERRRHDSFVGRAGLLARLDELLVADHADCTHPADRWVIVTGGPGMGKSALLAAWLVRR